MAVDRTTTLADAVADHVRAGDVIHPVVGHSRWSAATREVVRQWWGRDPGFTLVMLSLSSLGALFFRGGLVDRVITGYSGDTFPNFTPNRHFGDAYTSGDVAVEHWSFLAFAQRLEAGARGFPAAVTTSIRGSSMAANTAFAVAESPFDDGGELGLLAPLRADVAIVHAPLADRAGNVALHPPLLEGVWGALGARRGAIVTVERVVDDIRPWAPFVRIPAHRVLAVVEAPLGAHPGGLYAPGMGVDGYGEDYEFWVEARAATRSDDYDDWIRKWVLDVETQADWLDQLGTERIAELRAKAEPESWRGDAQRHPPDLDAPPNRWERAAVHGARHLARRIDELGATAVLAGAGVANLSAWLGVRLARDAGCDVELTAEIGLWGYDATPADPFVLNHRNFPTATMLSDASMVLGLLVGGAGATTVGCLGGAQIDRWGNINSTLIPDGPFLVGSGGGNDVASVATENVVVATLTPQRTPPQCGYITSPGHTVRALVTDLGTLEKLGDDELVLTAVPEGPGTLDDRIAVARDACGWELDVVDDVAELAAPEADEVAALRSWDPQGWFLRAR